MREKWALAPAGRPGSPSAGSRPAGPAHLQPHPPTHPRPHPVGSDRPHFQQAVQVCVVMAVAVAVAVARARGSVTSGAVVAEFCDRPLHQVGDDLVRDGLTVRHVARDLQSVGNHGPCEQSGSADS